MLSSRLFILEFLQSSYFVRSAYIFTFLIERANHSWEYFILQKKFQFLCVTLSLTITLMISTIFKIIYFASRSPFLICSTTCHHVFRPSHTTCTSQVCFSSFWLRISTSSINIKIGVAQLLLSYSFLSILLIFLYSYKSRVTIHPLIAVGVQTTLGDILF